MQVSTAPWLVLLSIVLAIEGGYLALRQTVQIGAAAGTQRRLLLAGASFSFGAAIWAMQFAGLLAARPGAGYLVLPVLLSFFFGVLIAGVAVQALESGPFTQLRLAAASGLLAAAMLASHYIGMEALSAGACSLENPLATAVGVVIAVAGSALALWLAAARPARALPAASVFGLAVAGMHYVAMAGTTFVPQAPPPALSSGMLAIVIAVVGFVLTVLFLLLLAPERAEIPENLQAALADNDAAEEPVAIAATGSGGDDKRRRGIFAPLGGAGAPPPRLADHLPIERDGATQFVAVDEVVAVQANAHYTYLFDGKTKLFCPLAIGEVESRLDRGRFMRVHRSHIVNIERVIGYKRSGDSETVELAADSRYTVPVSRSRAGWLKSRIGENNGASEAGEPPAAGPAK
jgi:NO-binding membrane sensor protein with MHYT domain/DNA-binding LytR/AlgR family response regulator